MNLILKKTLKGVGILVGFLLLILISIWVALQFPKVQTYTVNKITPIIEDMLQTDVRIGKVDIDFFKTLVLEEVYITDQQQDTLAYADKLKASIGLFSLFGQELHLSEIALIGSRIKLKRHLSDSLYNFQFLIDAFASDTTVVDTTSAAWGIDIDRVRIENAFLTLDDQVAPYRLQTQIGEFVTNINTLNLEKSSIKIDNILLAESGIDYEILKADLLLDAVKETVSDTITAPQITRLEFPDIGWEVQINEINLSDNYLTYQDRNYNKQTGVLDPNYLSISNLEFQVDHFSFIKNKIQTSIKNLSFQEEAFVLQQLATDIEVTTEKISIENFILATPKSQINNTTLFTFSEFNDLQDFLNQVQMDIQFQESKLAFSDLNFLIPQLQDIPQLNTQLERDLLINGNLKGRVADLQRIDFRAAIGNDLILNLTGNIQGLPEVENTRFDVQLKELSTSYQGLKKFTKNIDLPPALADLGRFRLNGNFVGTLGNLQGKKITFSTDTYTGFQGDLAAKGLPNMDIATFQMNINYLRTQSEDIAGFMEGEAPAELERLGQIQYTGTFNGTTTDFYLVGDLNSELGTLQSDLSIDFNSDYTDASYQGELSMKEFELGKMLGDTLNIGKVSFQAEADGKGLTPSEIKTELTAVVQSFTYLDYKYQDLIINGNVNGQEFSGQASIQDENITLDFDGLVSMNDSIPELRFTANVDTINLAKLNLSPEPYAVSLKINSDLEGNNADNLNGDIFITNLYLSNETDFFQSDSISLIANQLSPKNKSIEFNSEILNFLLKGNYNVVDLPELVINFVNDFFPVEELVSPKDTPAELALEPEKQATSTLPDQQFEFVLEIDDPLEFTRLFDPALTQMDTAYIKGNFDSQKKFLELTGKIPNIEYDGITIQSINLNSDGTTKKFNNTLEIVDFNNGSNLPISIATLQVDMYDDSLFVAIAAQEDTSSQKLRLGAVATKNADKYEIQFDENFVLNDSNWKVDKRNQIIYKNNLLNISNLAFSRGVQQIALNSRDKSNDEDYAPIELAFANFKLSEISKFIDQEDAFYEGQINGKVTVKDYSDNLHFTIDMSIDDILLNEEPVGNFVIQAEQASASDQIDILAILSGQNNNLEVVGNYKISSSGLDLKANMGSLELRVLDPFMAGVIEDSQGELAGQLDINGTTAQPSINGTIDFNDISTQVAMLGLRYKINNHSISINNTKIDLGQMNLVDENGYDATFSGQVLHQFFTDFELDLNFRTDRFQVLNTTINDNELYYGDLFVSGNVNITGSAFSPAVEVVRAETLSNSRLFIQPLSYEAALLGDADFIIFADPEEYAQDTTLSINDIYTINSSGIDLLMNLAVTDALELQIIIDPTTGDKLICRGNANVTVDMNAAGDLSVTGNYILTDGTYNLNYQGILKKEFDIRSGSNITMIGDPLNSRFDISATYTAKTTTYELIQNEATLSDSEEAIAKSRTNVNVLLAIRGTLDEPEISFDIQLPDNQSNTVSSTVARKLVQLKENETELNKQVFGLLLLGNFITQESGSGTLVGAGQSVALKSVSNLLSNQLNALADRFVKGVDLTFGVDSYNNEYAYGGEGATVTELQVGLSKSLFDNRLSITVGGNVNVGSSTATGITNTAAISSEFVIEYKITEDGRYRFRVFRRPDITDVLSQDNDYKTGVGLLFQKSF